MKKKTWLIMALACLSAAAFTLGVGCRPNKGGNDSSDSGDGADGYDPAAVSGEIVESTRTDGLTYIEDALGGKSYLVRFKGSDLNILPDTDENSAIRIQAALDRLDSEYGGGLLYLEKGTYIIGTALDLPRNTGIVGDWVAPEGENESKIIAGTVLDIRVGRGVDSTSRTDAAIKLYGNNLLSGLAIGYSEQSPAVMRKYPFTIANGHSVGVNIENLTLINSYRGILIDDQNVIKLKNIYMTALYEGIRDNYNYDVPTLYNINVSYRYWVMADSAFRAPSLDDARAITRTATAFLFGRVDWMYLDTAMVEGYEKAYYFYRNTSLFDDIRECNGQYMYMDCADCKYGIYVDTSSKIGNMFTRCSIQTTGADSAAVYFAPAVSKDANGALFYNTVYQFNSCTFKSEGHGVKIDGNAVAQLTYCDFTDWQDNAINITAGSFVADHCTFADCSDDIDIASTAQTAKIVNCVFEGQKQIKNGLEGAENAAERYIDVNGVYAADIAKYSEDRYYPSEITEPENKTVYYASDYGAVADGSLGGMGTDNTFAIQRALNAAGTHGGGYVVLDFGYYIVKERLVVPSGVHLVGNAAANRHFVGGKNAATLVTEYGKGKEKTDHAFITMEDDSALRNINVYYVDQDAVNIVKYSPTVAVSGDRVQVSQTIFIASYINFYVTGEDALIQYTRGLGLEAGCVTEGVNSGKFEYMFFSINDWMRIPHWGNEMPNCPPEGFHARYPNFENDTFVFENCKDVTLYNSFSYAQGTGLRLEGKIEGFRGIGIGIDMGRNSLILNNSGRDNIFVNTQFTSYDNHILANDGFSGEVTLYVNVSFFSGPDVTSTINGTGTINVQQFHIQAGSFTANSGTVNLQGLVWDDMATYLLIYTDKVSGGAINCLGSINDRFLVDGTENPNFKVENSTKRRYFF